MSVRTGFGDTKELEGLILRVLQRNCPFIRRFFRLYWMSKASHSLILANALVVISALFTYNLAVRYTDSVVLTYEPSTRKRRALSIHPHIDPYSNDTSPAKF